MPCPHYDISIVRRSAGQSAVAAAAYQSGDRLFCEYDGKQKYYSSKSGIVSAEILLPSHAPPELSDRNALWNLVENTEKRTNSQLARRIVMAIPREIPQDQYSEIVREYCQAQFVDKGMIADIAIHDKGDGNPHAHVLLTLRALDEAGKFLPKSRMVYELDENGQKMKTAAGNWKSHKEDTVDWNDQRYAEVWRHEWEVIVNRYYERNQLDLHVDLRSFKRQGIEDTPTVHMGSAVAKMEERGIETIIGTLNRDIQHYNRVRRAVRSAIKKLTKLIADLRKMWEKAHEPEPPTIWDYLDRFRDIRSWERRSWSYTAKHTADMQQLHEMTAQFDFLRTHNIVTVEDYEAQFIPLKQQFAEHTETLKDLQKQLRELESTEKHLTNLHNYAPIHKKYQAAFFKEHFKEKHEKELTAYTKAVRYFQKFPERKKQTIPSVKMQQHSLQERIDTVKQNVIELKTALDPLERIQYQIRYVLEHQHVLPLSEPISIHERLQEKQEQLHPQQPAPMTQPKRIKREQSL